MNSALTNKGSYMAGGTIGALVGVLVAMRYTKGDPGEFAGGLVLGALTGVAAVYAGDIFGAAVDPAAAKMAHSGHLLRDAVASGLDEDKKYAKRQLIEALQSIDPNIEDDL